MKIAITSMGETLDSLVSEKFGRAPHFIIFDTETDKFTSFANSAESINSGAGPEAVSQLSKIGVKIVFTKHLGGNAEAALKAAGIVSHTGISETKTVRQVIDDFKASLK